MNEKYQVEITSTLGQRGISITHNGYQWSAIRIENHKKEIPLIIAKLEELLKEKTE